LSHIKTTTPDLPYCKGTMPEFATPFTAYSVRVDDADYSQIAILYQCVRPKSYGCAQQLASFQTEELRQQGRFAGGKSSASVVRLCTAIVACVVRSISPHAPSISIAQPKARPSPTVGRDQRQARLRRQGS
jgi:hypothetical protein